MNDLGKLQRAIEENLAEHFCHLHRHLASATIMHTDDLLIADSGLDDDTFNIVAGARFTPEIAAARIAETTAFVEHALRPFSWWSAPHPALEISESCSLRPNEMPPKPKQACGKT